MKNLNKKLPDSPGVYLFKKGREVLYVGKATSLRDRVKSYFGKGVEFQRGPAIASMVDLSSSLSFVKTDSVLEALILESKLIKEIEPKYNTKEKDNKSFYYVGITNEQFPAVFLVRGRQLANENFAKKFKNIFGPFPSSTQIRIGLNILRKIFTFRDRCTPLSGKRCFDAQIGLCPGVCIGVISEKEYSKIIKNLCLFFNAKKERIVSFFEKEMKRWASKREFEKADEIKRKIFALKHIQDIALIKDEFPSKPEKLFRIEAYDISHFGGKGIVGAMTVVENGQIVKSEYRKFNIKGFDSQNDPGAIGEILDRRLAHTEWALPNLIVVDGGRAQINSAKNVLDKNGVYIPVVGVVKDDRHRPREILDGGPFSIYHKDILLANSESHRFVISFQKRKRF